MPGSALAVRPTAVAALVLSGLLGSCQDAGPRLYDSSNYPEQLSDWQLLRVQGKQLKLNSAVVPYQLATPLFSDYALKLRTVWLPDGSVARYRADEPFDFPVGTVISKTFYYPVDAADDGGTGNQMPRLIKASANTSLLTDNSLPLDDVRLIETRLLVHQTTGWEALPYVWNDEQTDATLQITGDIQRLQLEDSTFAYVVPNRNECAGCHVLDQNQGDLSPIGPAARHLNRQLTDSSGQPVNQLQDWAARGILQGLPAPQDTPANALWHPQSSSEPDTLAQQARAYLDINCGHCHQPGGSGDTSGLFLHAAESSAMRLGVCKPPVAAGRGAGGHRFSIVPGQPESSILSYRIESRETGVLMPELGRSLVHGEGLQLVNAWIAQQPGNCN